ncbi:MAG: AMP-binding protein [Clostridiales Family XIII bacterium]|jgi:long-chain acyl-CoA synthetase|nr:AMP-binding protein [Clostridiales Family XIII bacterium]
MIENTRYSDEKYATIAHDDSAWAQGIITTLKDSHDKFVRYTDLRPVYNLKQMWDESCKLYPKHIAFKEKPSHDEPYEEITYGKARSDARMMSSALLELELYQEKVAIMGDNGYAWASAYLAVVTGGMIAVPIDKDLSEAEVENLLIDSGVKAIFYSKKYQNMISSIHAKGKTEISYFFNNGKNAFKDLPEEERLGHEILRRELILRGNELIFLLKKDYYQSAQVRADDMAALIYTSGTTGMAKGVMLSHKNICTDLMVPPSIMHVYDTDVFFSVLPLHHTYECTCDFLIPLYRGATIAYAEGLKQLTNNLLEAKPTLLLCVPLLVENLYNKIVKTIDKEGKTNLVANVNKVNNITRRIGIDLAMPFFKSIRAALGGQLRLIICGGAKINPDVLQGIKNFGINAIQGYGLTECAPICALNPDIGGKNGAAGYIIPNFDARIDEPDPETGIGEIVVYGDNVMMGYYNKPEETAEVVKDGWFYTGDYGFIDDDRFITITGRKKSVIITKNGKNIFPEELEYLLNSSLDIESSMVYEIPRKTGEDGLVACSVHKSSSDVSDEAIVKVVNDINKDLASYKQIKKLFIRDEEFDMTTSKKIRRFEEANKGGREVHL